MSFQVAMGLFLLWFTPGAFATTSSCQAMLDEYLLTSETASWFFENANAKDVSGSPFFTRDQMMEKATSQQIQATQWLEDLMKGCYRSDFLSLPACITIWNRVSELNHLIGTSLSQTDTLNRNPIPQEGGGMRQQIMDQDQATARSNVKSYRSLRTQQLLKFRNSCLTDGRLWPRVTPQYQSDVPDNASLTLLRERFAFGETAGRESLEEGRYSCRVVRTDGATAGRISEVSFRTFLEEPLYELSCHGSNLNLRGLGSENDHDFQIALGTEKMKDRPDQNSLGGASYFFRVNSSRAFSVEVVNAKGLPPGLRSLGDLGLEPGVYSYWYCRRI